MCIMRPAEKAAAWKPVAFPNSPVTALSLGNLEEAWGLCWKQAMWPSARADPSASS